MTLLTEFKDKTASLARLLTAAMTSMLLLGILAPSGSGGTSDGFLNFSNTPFVCPRPTIITFDAPGSGTGPGQGTFPFAINPAGFMTGGYDLESDRFTRHGFLRAPDGTITTFDPPARGSVRTSPFSINPAGAICGIYRDASGLFHGFLRARDGHSLQTPRSRTVPGRREINANSINPAGAIAGFYQDASGDNRHGFLRAPDGTITTFDVPGPGHRLRSGYLLPCQSTCLNPVGDVLRILH